MMADGSPSYIARTFGGGTWAYTRSVQSGHLLPQTTTTVLDPANNETDLNFSGIYETERYAYHGTGGSKTLLKEAHSCYNGNWTSCPTATVTAPITYQALYDSLNQAGPQYAAYEYYYESHGLLYKEIDHDYTTGDPTIRTVITNYNTSLCSSYNVCDRPLNVQVNDVSGTSKSYTAYTYDGGGNTHGSVTQISRSTSGASNGPFVAQQYSYNSNGTLATATDPNSTVTTYSYAGTSCNGAFPTSVSVPSSWISGNLTTTYIYNCNGGVVTSATDPNGVATSIVYTDPYFWRPASSTDVFGNVTYYNYYGVNNSGGSAVTTVGQVESVMNWPGSQGNPTTDHLTTPDGYGRTVLQQTRQGPGLSNWDTVQTAYDGVGHVQFVTAPYVSTAGASQGPEPAEYWVYDGLNRVTDEKNYYSSIDINYSYNLNDVLVTGNPAPVGENPKRRQLEYDGLGRLTSVCEMTSAAGNTCGQNTSSAANHDILHFEFVLTARSPVLFVSHCSGDSLSKRTAKCIRKLSAENK